MPLSNEEKALFERLEARGFTLDTIARWDAIYISLREK